MDPDAHLTNFQKVGKLSRKLHLLEYWLCMVADILERIMNAFTWVDERATLILLGNYIYLSIYSTRLLKTK